MDSSTIDLIISIAIKKVNDNMETKYYIVARIDGDYAWLNRKEDHQILSACCRHLMCRPMKRCRGMCRHQILLMKICVSNSVCWR